MDNLQTTFTQFTEQVDHFLKTNNIHSQRQGEKLEKWIKIIINVHPLGKECVKIDTFQQYIAKMNEKRNENRSRKDRGIDLIGYDSNSRVIPIQVKSYLHDNKIPKEDIYNFYAEIDLNRKYYKWPPVTAWLIYKGELSKEAIKCLAEINKNKKIQIRQITLDELLQKIYDLYRIDKLKELWFDKWLSQITIQKPEPKKLRDYQMKAVSKASSYYQENNRGYMAMACGTGKTLTSLAIIEKITPPNGKILFLVPTLDLMRQTIEVARNDIQYKFDGFAVCSDVSVKRSEDENILNYAEIPINEVFRSAEQIKDYYHNKINNPPPLDNPQRLIVFSTYQSVDKIINAQREGFCEFDLVVCDEAHRTVKFPKKDEIANNNYAMIHYDEYLKAKKRLYMTATPKLFRDAERIGRTNEFKEIIFLDMSQEKVFGQEFFTYSFTDGVEDEYLADFQVIILAFVKDEYGKSYHEIETKYKEEAVETNQGFISLEDFTKLYGVYKALKDNEIKSAINFCRYATSRSANSKQLTKVWKLIIEHYKETNETTTDLKVEFLHVDGTMPSKDRKKKIKALETNDKRVILSNARCLTEGVDIPSLDAVIFMQPRKSEIDIVQATGRVMRRAENKTMGKVVIPVVASLHDQNIKELNFNFDPTEFKTIGNILGALRSPNVKPEIKSNIENYKLGDEWPTNSIEVRAIVDIKKLRQILNHQNKANYLLKDDYILKPRTNEEDYEKSIDHVNEQLKFESMVSQEITTKIKNQVQSVIVRNIGTRQYWETWSEQKLPTIVKDIKILLNSRYEKDKVIWTKFIKQIQVYLNQGIDREQVINLAADNFIHQPILEILFPESIKNNPVARLFQSLERNLKLREILNNQEKDLQKYYDNIKQKISKIKSSAAKQNLLKTIYEKYLTAVYGKKAKDNGVVYTPTEIIDFILKGVDYLLKKEFNTSFNSENIKILEPFAGTGTFISQILSENLNLIKTENLEYKYKKKIFANEIMLLPYYIASINISETFNNRQKGNSYLPYNNIIWTDTFELFDKDNNQSELEFEGDINSEKIKQISNEPINIIISNPPYSTSAKSKNIHNKINNIIFQELSSKTKSKKNKKALKDSYVKALMFGIEKIKRSKENGIIAFIVNNGFLTNKGTDSLRLYFHNIFSKFYIIDLKGDVDKNLKNKKVFADEGESIFKGTKVGSCILFGIINKQSYKNKGYYIKCEKIATRKEKLKWIINNDLENLDENKQFKSLSLDENNDWFLRSYKWNNNMILLSETQKNSNEEIILRVKSKGILFSAKADFTNFSKNKLIKSVKQEIAKYKLTLENNITSEINKYSRELKKKLKSHKIPKEFQEDFIAVIHTAPFVKKYCYYDDFFPPCLYKFREIFPLKKESPNIIINVAITPFAVKTPVDYSFLRSYQDGFNYPFFQYNKNENMNLFYKNRESCVSNRIKKYFAFKKLKDDPESNNKIFAYTYGFLHYDAYLKKYHKNLLKGDVPRIYKPKKYQDFLKIANIGKVLLDLHTNYEKQPMYKDVKFIKGNWELDDAKYSIKTIKFAENDNGDKDKTTIIFNNYITITNIPLEAYNWTLSDDSVIERFMKGYKFIDKKKQDPNDFCTENNNPRYIFELLLRVIYISLKTLELKKALPDYEKVEWDELKEFRD